jgi:hypothetical protein
MGLLKTVNIYKCDACGKKGKWGKGWLARTIYHKRWDEIITVCSEKCGEDFDKKKKR